MYSLAGEPRYRAEWDADGDEFYHHHGYDDDYRYDPYDDDIEEEEEEVPVSRLRGPKLQVQIIPFPGREAEAEEAARRARLQYGEDLDDYGYDEQPDDYLGSQSAGDGETTPIQRGTRPTMMPRSSEVTVQAGKEKPEQSEVHDSAIAQVAALSQDDYNAVSTMLFDIFALCCAQASRPCLLTTTLNYGNSTKIVALSAALWNALEDGLRFTDARKVVHNWDE